MSSFFYKLRMKSTSTVLSAFLFPVIFFLIKAAQICPPGTTQESFDSSTKESICAPCDQECSRCSSGPSICTECSWQVGGQLKIPNSEGKCNELAGCQIEEVTRFISGRSFLSYFEGEFVLEYFLWKSSQGFSEEMVSAFKGLLSIAPLRKETALVAFEIIEKMLGFAENLSQEQSVLEAFKLIQKNFVEQQTGEEISYKGEKFELVLVEAIPEEQNDIEMTLSPWTISFPFKLLNEVVHLNSDNGFTTLLAISATHFFVNLDSFSQNGATEQILIRDRVPGLLDIGFFDGFGYKLAANGLESTFNITVDLYSQLNGSQNIRPLLYDAYSGLWTNSGLSKCSNETKCAFHSNTLSEIAIFDVEFSRASLLSILSSPSVILSSSSGLYTSSVFYFFVLVCSSLSLMILVTGALYKNDSVIFKEKSFEDLADRIQTELETLEGSMEPNSNLNTIKPKLTEPQKPKKRNQTWANETQNDDFSIDQFSFTEANIQYKNLLNPSTDSKVKEWLKMRIKRAMESFGKDQENVNDSCHHDSSQMQDQSFAQFISRKKNESLNDSGNHDKSSEVVFGDHSIIAEKTLSKDRRESKKENIGHGLISQKIWIKGKLLDVSERPKELLQDDIGDSQIEKKIQTGSSLQNHFKRGGLETQNEKSCCRIKLRSICKALLVTHPFFSSFFVASKSVSQTVKLILYCCRVFGIFMFTVIIYKENPDIEEFSNTKRWSLAAGTAFIVSFLNWLMQTMISNQGSRQKRGIEKEIEGRREGDIEEGGLKRRSESSRGFGPKYSGSFVQNESGRGNQKKAKQCGVKKKKGEKQVRFSRGKLLKDFKRKKVSLNQLKSVLKKKDMMTKQKRAFSEKNNSNSKGTKTTLETPYHKFPVFKAFMQSLGLFGCFLFMTMGTYVVLVVLARASEDERSAQLTQFLRSFFFDSICIQIIRVALALLVISSSKLTKQLQNPQNITMYFFDPSIFGVLLLS